jgi:hypothetical protein
MTVERKAGFCALPEQGRFIPISDYHPNSADFFLAGILLKIQEISPRCARRNDTLGCHLERSERSRAIKRVSG